MKTCTKCHIEQSIFNFSKSNKTIDSYRTICKNCCNLENRLYKKLKKQNATKSCKVCNKEFPIKNSKVCSEECSKQNKLNSYLIPKSEIKCKICDIIFIGMKSQNVCSKDCKIIIKNRQEKFYKNKNKKEIECKNCNIKFIPLHKSILTCSETCKMVRTYSIKKVYYDFHSNTLSQNAKLYRKKNPEKTRKIAAKSRQKHLEKCKEATRNWNRNNRERIRNNPKYPYYRSMTDLRRRKAKKQSVPTWLTNEMKLQISQIYKERSRLSKENGIVYHVDHIIPLSGKTVCGLHVPWNLQIISAEENLKKGNILL